MTTRIVTHLRRSYGAHPLQLLLVLVGFVVAGYTIHVLGVSALWDRDTWWQSIALWFVGAALVHDLVLFPAYALLDRIVVRVRGRPRVPLTNYVRLPLLACGLVTLMFLPGVVRQGAGSYHRATGQTQEPFLHRWLILCVVILVLGLLAYLVARLFTGRRPASADDEDASRPGAVAAGDRPAPGWALVAAIVLALVVASRRRRPDRP